MTALAFPGASSAVNLVFDETTFLGLAENATTEDFEAVGLSGTPDGGALAAIDIGDFTVSSSPAAVKVLDTTIAGNHNTTLGGAQYLALDTDMANVAGDVTLSFDVPVYSVGFYLISIDHVTLLTPNPVMIVVDGVEYPILTTPTDGETYVGILSDSTFSTVLIFADPADSFWSLDDLSYSTSGPGDDMDVFFDVDSFMSEASSLPGSVVVEDFEAAPLSGTINGGALSAISFNDFTATSVPDAVKVLDTPSAGNHNTTPGGSKYLGIDTDIGNLSANLTLTFDEEVTAAGFYLISADHINAVDPTPVTVIVAGFEYPIPVPDENGEAFFGMTSRSAFRSVEIRPDDVDSFYSVDDVSSVPEPSAMTLGSAALFALAVLANRRRADG
jgi:hypothetical protein